MIIIETDDFVFETGTKVRECFAHGCDTKFTCEHVTFRFKDPDPCPNIYCMKEIEEYLKQKSGYSTTIDPLYTKIDRAYKLMKLKMKNIKADETETTSED